MRILSKLRKHNQQNSVLMCYSMHLPFLQVCHVVKLLKKGVRLRVIVPDLSEYMGVRTGVMKFNFDMLSRVSYFVVSRADVIVAITAQALSVFQGGLKKVVIEGIAHERYVSAGDAGSRKKYFLYSGTLGRRYGIRNFIDFFLGGGIENFDLLICGDDRKYFEAMASTHPRVKFLEQLNLSVVLNFQRNAKSLTNPRNNELVFTRYSFPSKIIEYMLSGTHMLMYELDGIPDEYYEFCFLIPLGSDRLSTKLLEVSKLSDNELLAKGYSAKRFIVEKMPGVQVHKLLEEIKGDRYV